MQLRKLGRSTLEIFPLSLGTNVLGRNIDEPTAFAVLDAYMEGGGNCIDTADSYSAGESERVLGRWMKARGNRDRMIIATKLGSPMAPGKQGLSHRYMFEEVEASLQRLQTEYIDLYQAHWDDESTPLEETLGAFARLIEQGKVRAIGASNYAAPRLKAALETSARLGLPRYESLQPLYNLMERGIEADLLPFCREHGLGVIPYAALAGGFLTGKYRSDADRSKSARGARAGQYLDARGRRVLAALDAAAARLHATPTQVALAWQIARPGIAAPITGATDLEQLRDLVKAATLALDREAVEALDAASR